MSRCHTIPSRVARIILFGALSALFLPGALAHASGGTLTFRATVSGKTHESGSFTHAISAQEDPTNPMVGFTGCAVIKMKAGSISGPYVLRVQTVMIQLAGLKPRGPGVNLEVDHFRPSSSAATYRRLDVTGTFAINGHSYGDGAGLAHGTVQVRNGGTSGTWTDPTAQRNYPARPAQPVPGFSFKASWTCSTMLHLNSP